MIVQLRAPEDVLSKKAKYRLHLSRISSSILRSFPSSSLMYCTLTTCLLFNPHPRLRCLYQSLMSPALAKSLSSPACTSRYLSYAACMTSPSFLHACRNARIAEPAAKMPCTVVQASSLPAQDSSNSARFALPSNNPDRWDCRI